MCPKRSRGTDVKSFIRALLVCAALTAPAFVQAQEDVTPPPIGGGTSYTRTVNGQVVEVTIVGPGEVNLTEVNVHRVSGTLVRLDPLAPTCQATIRWVNRNLQQTVSVSPGVPLQPFCIESGDIDRRPSSNHSQ